MVRQTSAKKWALGPEDNNGKKQGSASIVAFASNMQNIQKIL
jgi:hypothetical protein